MAGVGLLGVVLVMVVYFDILLAGFFRGRLGGLTGVSCPCWMLVLVFVLVLFWFKLLMMIVLLMIIPDPLRFAEFEITWLLMTIFWSLSLGLFVINMLLFVMLEGVPLWLVMPLV